MTRSNMAAEMHQVWAIQGGLHTPKQGGTCSTSAVQV